MDKPYFPMFINLWDKRIVVVGAGHIAYRRTKTLTAFCPSIKVIGREVADEFYELAKIHKLSILCKEYEQKDLYDADLVLAATDDKQVNDEIYGVCKSLGILVNVCSDQNKCDFFFPAVVQAGEVVIGVTASGADHGKVKAAADEIRSLFEEKKAQAEELAVRAEELALTAEQPDMAAGRPLRIGSRESRLAVIQSELVIDGIQKQNPQIQCRMVTMKTTGDKILDRTLDKIGGKGLFVKELDKALLEGKTDISVHSLKDMPMDVPEELPILAYSKRENPRDALVLPAGAQELDLELPIGCSSKRRIVQLQEIFPQACFKPIRGNVLTRLDKLDSGEYGALVLAVAGLKRLGLEDRISSIFSSDEIMPAAGQGIMAVQGRSDFDPSLLEGVNDRESAYAAISERAFVKRLDGGCSAPIAAYARVKNKKIKLAGMYYDEEAGRIYKGKLSGELKYAHNLGVVLAEKLLDEAREKKE